MKKDIAVYGHLLLHLTRRNLPRQAKQLHALIVLASLKPRDLLASRLISLYSETNQLSYARHVFNQIPQKDVFAYIAMLITYCRHEFYGEAIKLFGEMKLRLTPNNYTVTNVLKALSGGMIWDASLAKELHGFSLICGFDKDIFVLNALVAYYGKCDDVVMARRLFDRMRVKDVVSWNSMISGYSQCGFYDECKTLYWEMVEFSDLKPDKVIRYIDENRIGKDLALQNAIIALYAKCGRLDDARKWFDSLSDKDEVTYSSIITGYMIYGLVDNAIELFREMDHSELNTWTSVISGLAQNNEHESVLDMVRKMIAAGHKPNPVTLSSIIPSLSFVSNLKGGKEVHAYSIKNDYDHNIYVATSIIDHYAKQGFLKYSQRVFNRSKVRSLIIWTSIIAAHAVHGDAKGALDLYDDMLNCGIQPDSVTFTAILSACTHSGDEILAKNIFYSIFNEHGIQPSVEHYACMVTVFSKNGKLNEAVDFISKMPIEPNAKVWGALLNGAALSSDVELGKFAYDRLFFIEPENTDNYIIMANLYSQAGRWAEANEVREKMKNIGLQKLRGSSWCETSGHVQISIAEDVLNERVEGQCDG
ncbi:hypothetical protein ACFE04_031799 [Oxalis oulophora]